MDESGALSERADEFLSHCREVAAEEGLERESFVPECSRSMVEIKTRPATTLVDLSAEYLANVRLALRAGREVGVRLYPLATYPLPVVPSFRDESRYMLQARTVGRERFMDAGRCVGAHLHLEVPARTVDSETVVSRDASPEAQRELLEIYNLATALDPAIIALTRSCPFYEGWAPGLAARTAFYRGSALFGWEGVYAGLPEVGALARYASSTGDLVELQLSAHRAWLAAMEQAGVERDVISGAADNVLRNYWRPVRINACGTVELRSIDSNYPDVVMAVAALVRSAANRVREEGLTVQPTEEAWTFTVGDGKLFVPSFERLGTDLFHAAATGGVKSPEVLDYLDSVVQFAAPDGLTKLRTPESVYCTTEAAILRDFRHSLRPDGWLPEADGLRLVREACDRLEEQVGSYIAVG